MAIELKNLNKKELAELAQRVASRSRELDAEEVARRIPIIRDRAEIVHQVYRERLTQREQRVLVVRYVHRTPADQVARRTRLSEVLVAESMMTSARLVGEAFREARILQ